MKKIWLLFIVITILMPICSALSQTLSDYIAQVKGDTLVIKDYYDMGDQPNSLYEALLLDTDDVPAGRVYELKTNGYYPLKDNPVTLRNTVIVGEENTSIVNNDNASSIPPLICGADWESGSNMGGINFLHDLTVKNCSITPATVKGNLGWIFFSGGADSVKLILQNCLFEQTRWVFLNTSSRDISWYIKDCYFVNMNGNYARRSGGVIDISNHQDTLWVENSTHIMGQGMLYKLRGYSFNRVIFNHNTFINISNFVFSDLGSQSAMSVTNNIFVNCNIQPYSGKTYDLGEYDIDKLPTGIVNVYPDTAIHIDRKYLVDNNVIYWDPRLADIVATLNANQVNGSINWASQMITMNQRTQSMFDDDVTYPYLAEGVWHEELPNFKDPKDLLTTEVDVIKEFSTTIVDTQSGGMLPDWRLVNTGEENFIFADWPIPVDLSYDDADLLTGGMGGFPIGDLNWFSTQKASWLAQRNAEYQSIHDALNTYGLYASMQESSDLPASFQLWQNYPNPFNPFLKPLM